MNSGKEDFLLSKKYRCPFSTMGSDLMPDFALICGTEISGTLASDSPGPDVDLLEPDPKSLGITDQL
jgi:hypothetical protein